MLVIGAGLPRTATRSLKEALERLLPGPCYHMHEVFEHPEHVPFWRTAIRDDHPDWKGFMAPYSAAVDWPASAFWRELSNSFPLAVVVLSVRDSAQTWWDSANSTILPVARRDPGAEHDDVEWHEMFGDLIENRFTPDWDDPDAAMAAYERHNETVRQELGGTGRLVEWKAEDGWEPLCDALGLPVPAETFPRMNTREEWFARRAELQQAD